MNVSGIDAGITIGSIGSIKDDVAIITFGLKIPHDDDSTVLPVVLVVVSLFFICCNSGGMLSNVVELDVAAGVESL